MSVTPHLRRDETKNRGAYTPLTSMVPLLRFKLAETTSVCKRPSAAGAQLSEAPVIEAERQENPAQGKPIALKTGAARNKLIRKLTGLSLRFQKASG